MSARTSTSGRRRFGSTAALLVVVAWLATPALGVAHSPDPAIAWPLFGQDQALEFRWLAGEVPPAKMQAPILAAAADANASRGSRAPTLALDPAGTSSVEYGPTVFCGVNGLACADGWNAPSSFRVAFREHGHVFDWGRLQWCQMQAAAANGCYDVENIALDEFGHVLGLGHHGNHADASDYLDAVVQTVSRARPKAGWNAHQFGRCDTAKLQMRYDMVNTARRLSTCLDLGSSLALAVTERTIGAGGRVTFTATLRLADQAAYERLRGNLLSERVVILQRRTPGAATWTTVGTMAHGPASGTYVLSQSPTATWEWRAWFSKPADEGIRASSSAPFAVTVTGCTRTPCPQVAPAAGPAGWRR